MAVTPGGRVGDASPLGKGKRRLTDYEREVAHALIREHGFSRSHAIATAKSQIKRWAAGGGKVRPQVRAGAAASIAQSLELAEPHRYKHGWIRLYHGTTPENAEKIKQSGLHENPNVPAAAWYQLTTSKEQAARYSRGAVVELHVPNTRIYSRAEDTEDPVLWPGGPHNVYGHDATAYAVKGTVPASMVREVHMIDDLDFSFRPELHPRGRGGKFKSRGITSKGRVKRKLPAESKPHQRQARKARMAQQELARRIIARQGLHRGALSKSPTPRPYSGTGRDRARFLPTAGVFASNSAVLDIALAEAAHRDIDFTPHWKHGWIPLNAEAQSIAKARKEAGLGKGSVMPSGVPKVKAARRLDRSHRRERAGPVKQAKAILARHTTQDGMAKVTAADERRKAAEATGSLHGIDAETRSAQAHGEKLLDRAALHEPKITSDLQGSVESHGGVMDSLMESATAKGDFRLKTIGSLTRKIRDKSKKKNRSQEEYAAEIGDALRYTAVFDNKTMVKDLKAWKKDMEAKGYHFATIENTFARNQAYAGINMNLVSPTGQIFEVQAHSHESIYAKHHIHDDYEIYRSEDPAVTESDKIAAYNRMVAVNRQLIRPNDWQRFGELKHMPDVERHREVLVRAAEKRLYERGVYRRRTARQHLRVR